MLHRCLIRRAGDHTGEADGTPGADGIRWKGVARGRMPPIRSCVTTPDELRDSRSGDINAPSLSFAGPGPGLAGEAGVARAVGGA